MALKQPSNTGTAETMERADAISALATALTTAFFGAPGCYEPSSAAEPAQPAQETPSAGGSYRRDPITGALTRVPAQEAVTPEPNTEPSEE